MKSGLYCRGEDSAIMNVREWALPIYTILMQLAAGSLLFLWILRAVNISHTDPAETDSIVRIPILIIFLTIILALIGAHFHLSRPYLSFLAVSNFRTSWLSRETVFTVCFIFTTGCLLLLQWFVPDHARLRTVVGWIAILFGLTVIYCMSQIYLLPTQPDWDTPYTVISFYITVVILGSTALPAILLVDLTFLTVWKQGQSDRRLAIVRQALVWSTGMVVAAWITVVALNIYQINLLRVGNQWTQTSYELLMRLYQPLLVMRVGLPLVGIVWLVISVYKMSKENKTITDLMMPVYASCISVMVGEILGRFLFYAIHVRIGV